MAGAFGGGMTGAPFAGTCTALSRYLWETLENNHSVVKVILIFGPFVQRTLTIINGEDMHDIILIT